MEEGNETLLRDRGPLIVRELRTKVCCSRQVPSWLYLGLDWTMHLILSWVSVKQNLITFLTHHHGEVMIILIHGPRQASLPSAQSCQNLRYLPIQAESQAEPSDRKPDPWPLWMAEHAQLKFVMTECSKTQIRLTGLTYINTEDVKKSCTNRSHQERETEYKGFI